MTIRTMFTFDTPLFSSGPLSVTQLYAPSEPALRDRERLENIDARLILRRKLTGATT